MQQIWIGFLYLDAAKGGAVRPSKFMMSKMKVQSI